jgi:hypothetical protein
MDDVTEHALLTKIQGTLSVVDAFLRRTGRIPDNFLVTTSAQSIGDRIHNHIKDPTFVQLRAEALENVLGKMMIRNGQLYAEPIVLDTMAKEALSLPDGGTVQDALQRAVEFARDLVAIRAQITPEQSAANIAVEQAIQQLPPQNIAPYQFELRNSTLVVADQPANFLDADADNITAAREALLAQGEMLLRDRRLSNWPYVEEAFQQVHARLVSPNNVIQLAIFNLSLGEVLQGSDGEITDTLHAGLVRHWRSVADFVSQFPEWRQYNENASETRATAEDVATLCETALGLAETLDELPESIDSSVPNALRQTVNWVTANAKVPGQKILALGRTLANLLVAAFRFSRKPMFLKFASEVTIDLRGALKDIVVVAILVAATNGITALSHIPGNEWLAQSAVMAVLYKHISNRTK